MKLQHESEIDVDPQVKDLLQAESTKQRPRNTPGIISRELNDVAHQLWNNDRIIIRQANKASTYVILDREDYVMRYSCR